MKAFTEVLALYRRIDGLGSLYTGSFADTAKVRDELAEAIIRMRPSATVGDALKLWGDVDDYYLLWEALAQIIKRDAANEYDQLDGFIFFAREEDELISEAIETHSMNGSQLCEWILARHDA